MTNETHQPKSAGLLAASGTPPPLLCGISQAAAMLGVGRSTVYELLKDQRLQSVSIGRRRLVRIESLSSLAAGETA